MAIDDRPKDWSGSDRKKRFCPWTARRSLAGPASVQRTSSKRMKLVLLQWPCLPKRPLDKPERPPILFHSIQVVTCATGPGYPHHPTNRRNFDPSGHHHLRSPPGTPPPGFSLFTIAEMIRHCSDAHAKPFEMAERSGQCGASSPARG
jgi:hypothetical protein